MIFLTGFMGAGKTTIGGELAKITGLPFIDLDEEIVLKTGCTIPYIFKYAGEKAFRKIERDVLSDIAEKGDGIIATGGGAPVNPLNRLVMKASGMIVNLTASLETHKKRVGKDSNRPNWNEGVEDLFKARQAAYSDADLIIDTDDLNVKKSARKIKEFIGAFPGSVPVLIENHPYPVYIGRGILEKFGMLIKRHLEPEGLFCLVDENVNRLYKKKISMSVSGFRHIIMEVPEGEGSKSQEFLDRVLSRMLRSGMNRQWACIAIGGGVTGDLSGFAAGVFMRGIPIVQVPTTLLSQIDAGIGGKTGINHELGKNLIGMFKQPEFVLCDPVFHETLDDEDFSGGMGEVIKYGIVMDRPLFEGLEKESLGIETVLRMCCRDKAYVVARDEMEGSLRRVLNFGHTLAHAIERYYDYNIHHGEAVAMGIKFASFLSGELGLMKSKDISRVQRLIDKYGMISGRHELPPAGRIGRAMALDKKSASGGIHYVLAKGIGDFEIRKLKLDFILDAYKRYMNGCKKGIC
jgi:shikimate kinase / 3-dehydroquinate synthase